MPETTETTKDMPARSVELRKIVHSCLMAAMSIEHERMVGRLSPQMVGEQLQKTEDRLFELLRDLASCAGTAEAAPLARPVSGEAWQSIETAPKQGRILLTDGEFVGQGYWIEALEDGVDYMGHDAGFVDSDYTYFSCARAFGTAEYRSAGTQPTHWMPLPSAAKKD